MQGIAITQLGINRVGAISLIKIVTAGPIPINASVNLPTLHSNALTNNFVLLLLI